MIKKCYSYADIFLVPKKTIVPSRSVCNTKVKLGKNEFDMPIIAANMPSVVNKETCNFLAKHNLFYIMHRFDMNQAEFVEEMKQKNFISSISMGVNKESYSQLKELKEKKLEPDYITIDTANGWSLKAERMTKYIKNNFDSFLIVGNVATPDAVRELDQWGADAIKLFIGPGRACTTKLKTGFTYPTVSCLLECREETSKPIIADGGVIEHGDIAKAIACGARMVMAGALFCQYNESAGKTIEIENQCYKEYYGSASEHNKLEYKNVEGKKILLPCKGEMSNLLKELKQDLQSSISYAGGDSLFALREVEKIAI